MTIETGPAQITASRPTAESNHGKEKQGAPQGRGPSGARGFMAILASMGIDDQAASGTSGMSANANGSLGGPFSAFARVFGASNGALNAGKRGVAEDGSAADIQSQGGLATSEDGIIRLLSGDVVDGVDLQSSVPGTALQTDVPLDTAALLAQAAQWTNVPAESGSGTGSGDTVGVNLAGAPKLPRAQTALDGAGVGGATIGDSLSELAGKSAKSQKDALARMVSAQAALSTQPTEASNSVADQRQNPLAVRVAETNVPAIATTLAASSVLPSSGREESARERSVFRATVSDSASAASPSYMPSASGTTGSSAPEPVTPTDTYIAEKVAYWISNDVQNAEMKLEGIGDKPVEVSIRMQGNEAHIAFRSDELQAREALENASVQLKDMLQREGVVLSGVSVGTSGSGTSDDPERKSRQGARQSSVISAEPAGVDRAPGAGRVSTGRLDLFV